MLKVVIADDELRVCRLVQLLADWPALGMEVVATAANGIEALARIEQLSPDILITDIRMPGYDGLELIKRAKALSPHLEIMIISGYAHFEYAQSAIQFGVGDYLLKPIKKKELTAALERLGERCRTMADSSAMIEHLHRNSEESLQLLQGRLVEDLMQKQLSAPTPERLHAEYHVDITDGILQVYILKMDYAPEKMLRPALENVRLKAEELFSSMVSGLCYTSIFQFRDSVGCGVVNYDPNKRDEVRSALRHCLNQLEAQKSLFGYVEFSLALGGVVSSAEQLPSSLEDALRAVSERLIEGTGKLLEVVLPASSLKPQQLLDGYNRVIALVLDSQDVQIAEVAVQALEAAAKQVPDIRGQELLELVVAAGTLFVIRVNMEDEERLLQDFRERCGQCSRVEDLFACLHSLQRQQLEYFARRENEEIKPIRIAKQYIHQHYGEQIMLEDVCAVTGFSVSYFSTMFKKETGEGFNKYLTRVRIERAKLCCRKRISRWRRFANRLDTAT